MRQVTKDEAVLIYKSGLWQDWTDRERANFQIRQDLLCMPIGVFQDALANTLGREVYTHEMGLSRAELQAELEGKKDAPTVEEIVNLLAHKTTIVL